MGANMHVYRDNTVNLITYNKNTGEFGWIGKSKNQSKKNPSPTKKDVKYKFCRYCGKPIGSNPWQCSGGWM